MSSQPNENLNSVFYPNKDTNDRTLSSKDDDDTELMPKLFQLQFPHANEGTVCSYTHVATYHYLAN